MAIRPVLLLTNELSTVNAVSTALESNGKLDPGNVCQDLSVLTGRLEREAVPAVLVDIDQNPRQTLLSIEPLARRYSQTRFVVLSKSLDSTLLLEAMQAGARHFMVKQSVAAELHDVLIRLCPPAENANAGRAITILSAGGGCGATTIAINLASEVKLASGMTDNSASLVVDFDHNYGSVGTYLGVDADYGVFDLFERSDAIDEQLITSCAVAQPGGTPALLSTSRARLGDPCPELDPRRVSQLLDACRSAHPWTVVDAPRVTMPAAAALATHSDATIIVMQLMIKDIRIARHMMQSLITAGVPAASIELVVNRYKRRSSFITIEEARTAMGLDESVTMTCFSNDYAAANGAVNLGKPLSQHSPRSDFRRDMQRLATRIVAAKPAPTAA